MEKLHIRQQSISCSNGWISLPEYIPIIGSFPYNMMDLKLAKSFGMGKRLFGGGIVFVKCCFYDDSFL